MLPALVDVAHASLSLAQRSGFRIRIDCCGLPILAFAAIGAWYVFFGRNKGDRP